MCDILAMKSQIQDRFVVVPETFSKLELRFEQTWQRSIKSRLTSHFKWKPCETVRRGCGYEFFCGGGVEFMVSITDGWVGNKILVLLGPGPRRSCDADPDVLV